MQRKTTHDYFIRRMYLINSLLIHYKGKQSTNQRQKATSLAKVGFFYKLAVDPRFSHIILGHLQRLNVRIRSSSHHCPLHSRSHPSRKELKQAGDMAHWLELLQYKHEDKSHTEGLEGMLAHNLAWWSQGPEQAG